MSLCPSLDIYIDIYTVCGYLHTLCRRRRRRRRRGVVVAPVRRGVRRARALRLDRRQPRTFGVPAPQYIVVRGPHLYGSI